MKIHRVGAELFYADGQTDITKLIAFRDFSKAPNESKAAIIILTKCVVPLDIIVLVKLL